MGCREATWILDDVNNWWQMLCINSLKHLEMLGSWRLFGKIVFVEIFVTREIHFFYQISMKFVGFWLWKIKKATWWVYISRFLCVSKLMSISERSKRPEWRIFQGIPTNTWGSTGKIDTFKIQKGVVGIRGDRIFWIWECFKSCDVSNRKALLPILIHIYIYKYRYIDILIYIYIHIDIYVYYIHRVVTH